MFIWAHGRSDDAFYAANELKYHGSWRGVGSIGAYIVNGSPLNPPSNLSFLLFCTTLVSFIYSGTQLGATHIEVLRTRVSTVPDFAHIIQVVSGFVRARMILILLDSTLRQTGHYVCQVT